MSGQTCSDESISKYLKQTQHWFYPIKLAAVLKLKRCNDIRSFDTFVKLLKDRSSRIRFFASVGLGDLGDERAVLHLTALFESPKCDKDAIGTSIALGQIGGIAFVSLTKILLETKDVQKLRWKRRVCAATGLKLIGVEAVPSLLKALKDPISNVRRAAVWTLGEINDTRAINPLMELYQIEQSIVVRKEIIEAISKFDDENAREMVKKATQDKNSEVRKCARKIVQKLTANSD